MPGGGRKCWREGPGGHEQTWMRKRCADGMHGSGGKAMKRNGLGERPGWHERVRGQYGRSGRKGVAAVVAF